MVPVILFGGITIVVEPLRALIESLQNELRRRKIRCERLLTTDDARGDSTKLAAVDRLEDLILNWRSDKKALVIITTPELIYRDYAMLRLVKLKELGKLRRFVIDEFDLWWVKTFGILFACRGSLHTRALFSTVLKRE